MNRAPLNRNIRQKSLNRFKQTWITIYDNQRPFLGIKPSSDKVKQKIFPASGGFLPSQDEPQKFFTSICPDANSSKQGFPRNPMPSYLRFTPSRKRYLIGTSILRFIHLSNSFLRVFFLSPFFQRLKIERKKLFFLALGIGISSITPNLLSKFRYRNPFRWSLRSLFLW